MSTYKLILVLIQSSIILSTNTGITHAGRFNVSLIEMATCKEYDLTSRGYMYADFFRINTLNNNRLKPDERLHLKFYVKTTMDAHIVLAVNDHPRLMDRVYEIVIGAGGNTFSAIRVSMGRRRVATSMVPDLLSIFDPTPIEIIQKQDGTLFVYIPGYKDTPLLNFTDTAPLQINFISFSTFGTISARWYYDCKFDGFESEFEQEKRPLTPYQRLVNFVLNASTEPSDNSRIVPSADTQEVYFSFQIQALSFSQATSMMNTRMNILLQWTDPRLKWDPKEYGTHVLVEPSLRIWQPNLILENNVFGIQSQSAPEAEMRILSNGTVLRLLRNSDWNTRCVNIARNWPNERLQCESIFGLNSNDLNGVRTTPLLVYDLFNPIFNGSVSTLSEWRFLQLGIHGIDRLTGGRTPRTGDIAVTFDIMRNGMYYKTLFLMPFLAAHALLVLSFCLAGYRRGAIILVVFVIVSLGLMFLTKHAPQLYIPNIMAAYVQIMRVATFSYILHIVILWLDSYPPRSKPSDAVMGIVNLAPLRFLLCMRFADSTDYVRIQEHPWHEISKMLNNICFVFVNAYLLILAVLVVPN